MNRKKVTSRIGSLALAVLLAFGTLPQAAFAAGETSFEGTSSEITAFAALEDNIKNREVSLGTSFENLNLPDTLNATVAEEPAEISVTSWTAEPEYAPDADGEYTFTPALATGYTLADEVSLPTISVTVLAAEEENDSETENSVIITVDPDEPLYFSEGEPITDADLLTGVTAKDENGDSINVTVKSVDGLDMENPAPKEGSASYIITYAAKHPMSEKEFTVTREAYVTVGIMPLASSANVIDLSDSDAALSAGATASGGRYNYNTITKEITINSGQVAITGTTTDRQVQIADGVTVDVTLNGMSIDVSAIGDACAFELTGSSAVNLTLSGTNTLKSGANKAGLQVNSNSTLTIIGTDMDSLTVTGGHDSAGIGGGSGSTYYNGGTIKIGGGTVTANGGWCGAGIGGGLYGSGGTIEISGGTVNANSGGYSAGVGGGPWNHGGNIIISGGTVTATGDNVDIGPGYSSTGTGGTITITGGSVKAGSVSPQPTNGSNPVYLNTLTVGNPSIGNDIALSAMGYDTTEYYGNNDVVTTNGGKVYMWLPQNSSASAKVDVIVPGSIVYTRTWARTGTTETGTLLLPGNAVAPNITGQPQGAIYNVGDLATSFSVTASVTDGGTLSYQWYQCDDSEKTNAAAITGETAASYTPNTGAVGTKYYYCIVTNTNTGVSGTQTAATTSDVAEVKVIDKPTVGNISTPTAVNVGDTLSLTAPIITDNNAAITAQGWEISTDNTNWTAFDPTTTMTYAYNGQYLRYYATNSAGTGYSNAVQLTVNKLNLTLSLSCADITYGGTLSPVLTGNTGGGTETYEYKTQGAASSTYTTTVPTDAGDYTVRASVAATTTYNADSATADFRINKATPAIDFTATPTTGALADDSITLTASLSGVEPSDYPTGNVVFKNGSTILATVALVNGVASYTWSNVPYGTHNLTAEYAGDTNYEDVTGNITGYDVQKRTQSTLNITGVPANIMYGDSSFTLGITGGNGSGAVTYTVQSGDAVSISGNTVTIEKAGIVTIQATKAGDSVYNEISTTITFTVEKAEPNIPANQAVNGANVGKALSEVSLSGLTANGVDTAALAGSFAWQNPQTVVQGAGKQTVIFTPTDADNYNSATFEVQVNLDTTKPVIASVQATTSLNSAKLEVAATAGTPLTYQWQVKGSWIDIPGATSAVFDYTGLSADTEYTVRVIVTDANGNSTTSEPVTFKTGKQVVSGLPGGVTITDGNSVTWTPNPPGGTWEYDSNFLNKSEKDGTVTFTAKKTGTTTVKYTVNGTEQVITITVAESTIPKTGDTGNMSLWIGLLCISLAGITGMLVWGKKRKTAFGKHSGK